MWQDDSPWGTPDHESISAVPPRASSPLPTLASFNSNAMPATSTSSWGANEDDGGGWGTSLGEDFTTATTLSLNGDGFASTSAIPLDSAPYEMKPPSSPSRNTAPMWSPPKSSFQELPDVSAKPMDESTEGPAIARTPSPPGFQSPTLPPLADVPASATLSEEDTSKISKIEEEEVYVEPNRDDDWGEHGAEPDFPPISSLKLEQESSTIEEKTWGESAQEDDEWVPPEVPAPLPTLGDMFGKSMSAERRPSAEEGWGGEPIETVVPSWSMKSAMVDEEDRQSVGADDEAGSIKSGDAWGEDHHDGSGIGENQNEDVEEDHETDQQQSNDAETRDQSIVSTEHNEEQGSMDSQAGAGQKKSSWWGSKAEAAANKAASITAASSPPPATGRASSPAAESSAAPSRLGRLFGRLRRNQTGSDEGSTASNDPSQPSVRAASPQPEQQPTSSMSYHHEATDEELPPEWRPKNLDVLAHTQPKPQPYFPRGEQLDEVFGQPQLPSRRTARRPNDLSLNDDFGGLLGAFSEAPRKLIPKPKGPPRAHDPFDPFAEDVDEQTASAPTLAPPNRMTVSPAFSSPSSFSMASPPASTSNNRSKTSAFVAQQQQQASFGSNRTSSFGTSTIPSSRRSAQATQNEDTFDAFFDSVTNNKVPAPQTSTYESFDLAMPAPRSVSAPKAFVVPPPSIMPRVNLSRGATSSTSPPPRASTASPTYVNPLAPPPPPSQPLANRHLIGEIARPSSAGGQLSSSKPPSSASAPFGSVQLRSSSPLAASKPPPLIPPPGMDTKPLAPSPVGSIKRPTSTTQPLNNSSSSAVAAGVNRPLGAEDWSFFES